jgi:hypothetical protein
MCSLFGHTETSSNILPLQLTLRLSTLFFINACHHSMYIYRYCAISAVAMLYSYYCCILCNKHVENQQERVKPLQMNDDSSSKGGVKKANPSTKFGDGMGVRALLCIGQGKCHKVFLGKIVHCKRCYDSLKLRESNGEDLTELFNHCSKLISKFPPLVQTTSVVTRPDGDDNFNFWDLLVLYKLWKQNKSPAFRYMVMKVEKTKDFVLLPALCGDVVNIIKLAGDNKYGEWKMNGAGDTPGSVLLSEVLRNGKPFQLPESRIYRPDYEGVGLSASGQIAVESLQRKLTQQSAAQKILREKMKMAKSVADEAVRKEAVARVMADVSYAKGCGEAIALYQANESLLLRVEELNKVSKCSFC